MRELGSCIMLIAGGGHSRRETGAETISRVSVSAWHDGRGTRWEGMGIAQLTP